MEIFLQDRILPLLSSHLFSTGDANRTLINHRADIISMDRYTVELCIYLYRRWCEEARWCGENDRQKDKSFT